MNYDEYTGWILLAYTILFNTYMYEDGAKGSCYCCNTYDAVKNTRHLNPRAAERATKEVLSVFGLKDWSELFDNS